LRRSRPADTGEGHRGEHSDQRHREASARYTAALSHHKAKARAPTSGMRVTLAAKSDFGQGHLVCPLANNALSAVNVGRRTRSSCGPQSGSSVYESARAIHAN
jgi:hypothetical protein